MAHFIVFEGIDGSGKGTQVELVAARLRESGKTVAILDFPRYGNPSAYFVEKYLNGAYGGITDVGAKRASVFYALDRFDAKAEIESMLAQNDYVLSNRYVSSSMVHQATKAANVAEADEYIAWLEAFEYGLMGIPRPERVVFLKISPETSARLISAKEQRAYITSGTNKDLHESDSDHLRKAAEMALHVATKFDDWTVIECEENGKILSKEEITKRILSTL